MAVTNERTHTNRQRAESFGTRAAQYDRVRPGYPDALFDDLLALGLGEVLDVGCGTGKAAVPLAARGLRVLGVEIDERMAAVARSHGVAVEVAAFESWDDAGRRFDLVVSGQAWHWVDPARGARKVALVLRPAGHLALFWNVGGFHPEVRRRMDDVYISTAAELKDSAAVAGARLSTTVDPTRVQLQAAGLSRQRTATYRWRRAYTRAQWLELLATHSDHATLAPEVFARLRKRVSELIDDLGGSIAIEYVTRLLLVSR